MESNPLHTSITTPSHCSFSQMLHPFPQQATVKSASVRSSASDGACNSTLAAASTRFGLSRSSVSVTSKPHRGTPSATTGVPRSTLFDQAAGKSKPKPKPKSKFAVGVTAPRVALHSAGSTGVAKKKFDLKASLAKGALPWQQTVGTKPRTPMGCSN